MKIPRNRGNLNVKETLILKNKIELNNLTHKMQLLQRELHHFTNNFEYYIENSALKQCQEELRKKLQVSIVKAQEEFFG